MSPQMQDRFSKLDKKQKETIQQLTMQLEQNWKVGKIPGWSIFAWAEFLRSTLLPLLKELGLTDIEKLPIEFRQSIHDAIKLAYDKMIRPINFPLIIEPFETKLENKVWEMFCNYLCDILKLDKHPEDDIPNYVAPTAG